MKLETLRFQAFGPYIEEQMIDFTEMKSHPLFLIRGETGAGKSVILDAITYALYGKSSGGERGDWEDMRSRLAPKALKTYVELCFTIDQHHYRFYREISIHTKRSGDEINKITIDGGEIINDVFEPFFENCKLKLLEEKAIELIGLNHAQFIQVMMLPQGKFEQLLVSKSDAKQEILKTLFQVTNWDGICDRLTEKQRIAKGNLDQFANQHTWLLKQAEVDNFDDLASKTKEHEQTCMHLKQEVDESKKAIDEANQQVQKQVQYADITNRLWKQLDMQQDLQKQADSINDMRTKLANWEAIEHVIPYFDAWQTAFKQEQLRSTKLQDATLEVQKSKNAQKEAQVLWSQLPQQRSTLQGLEQSLTKVTHTLGKWVEIEDLLQQNKKLQKQVNHAQRDLDVLQKQWNEVQVVYRTEQAEVEKIQRNNQAYPQRLKQLQAYDTAETWIRQSIILQTQMDEEEQKQVSRRNEQIQLQAQSVQMQEAHDVLYRKFLDHSATLLSQLLEAGKPCPVCGSLHHEQMQHVNKQAVEVNQVKDSQAALDELHTKLQANKQMIQQRSQQVETWQMQQQEVTMNLQKLLPDGYDKNIHEQIRKDVEILEQVTRKQNDLQQHISALHRQLDELQSACSEMQAQQQMRKQTILVNEATIKEKQKMNLDPTISIAELQHQEKQLREQRDSLQVLIGKQENDMQKMTLRLHSQETNLKNAQAEYDIALTQTKHAYEAFIQHGGKEPFAAFQIQNVEVSIWKQQVQAYDENVQENRIAIQTMQVQLEGTTLLDVEVLRLQAKELDHTYQKLLATYNFHQSKLEQLHQIDKELQTIKKDWELAQQTYIRLNEFVRIMRGDNGMGMERYVLGIMLSSITQCANQLLNQIHNGRYQIYRCDETSGRTRKFGLEFMIYDSYSGSMRSVVSLSGGEKFLVSLALSLALSTVIQARNGGIKMEMMFIDEGFGSLDEQSIADALQVLSTMSQNKAFVGIISHVELLKENIPYGIEVTKTKQGSHLHVLV